MNFKWQNENAEGGIVIVPNCQHVQKFTKAFKTCRNQSSPFSFRISRTSGLIAEELE